ncbi:hypothetical protein SCG7086_CP_00020 [Chlamydiales bacterium SCGC AG-110-P3]|nr:hypothetical protein SCG7086_CP_00020 [Chlamydiales bacterium SCGC AG-110-P3]
MSNLRQIAPSRRSSILGMLLYYLVPIRRQVIASNLRRVYGADMSRKKQISLMQAFYIHMLRFVKEIALSPFKSRRQRKQQVVIEGLHNLENVLSQGKGALWLCCHLGNWEIGLVNFMEHVPHLRGQISLIRKPLRPSLLNRFVMGRFEKAGIGVMPPNASSLKQILKRLRRNESIMFVHDQHTSIEAATRTEFLGHTIQAARSLAKIALKTGAPVIPAITWRTDDGNHICHFGAPIPAVEHSDPDEAVRLTTLAYNKTLESYVLRHPEQWFGWAHRLWKAAEGPIQKNTPNENR